MQYHIRNKKTPNEAANIFGHRRIKCSPQGRNTIISTITCIHIIWLRIPTCASSGFGSIPVMFICQHLLGLHSWSCICFPYSQWHTVTESWPPHTSHKFTYDTFMMMSRVSMHSIVQQYKIPWLNRNTRNVHLIRLSSMVCVWQAEIVLLKVI